MTREVWRDIPGWEGHYKVSNLGRVKSLARWVLRRSKVTKIQHWFPVAERMLKPGPQKKSGHLSVVLGTSRDNHGRQVHELVMTAFVGPRPAGMEVLHRNHNASDNRKTNLKYGTRSENLKADYLNGSRVYMLKKSK